MRRTEILWCSDTLRSAEHGVLERVDDGWEVRGVAVLPIGDLPGHIEYAVTTDDGWSTRRARVSIRGASTSTYEIEATGGSWRVNGAARPDLDGCIDIDLGWTPATNILPIRRLGLAVGDRATTTAAWFRFPEMSIERNVQQYTRLDERRWRYESDPYDFVLDVDDLGRVLRYGDDLWRAVSVS